VVPGHLIRDNGVGVGRPCPGVLPGGVPGKPPLGKTGTRESLSVPGGELWTEKRCLGPLLSENLQWPLQRREGSQNSCFVGSGFWLCQQSRFVIVTVIIIIGHN
jgi:hypothetical protein